MVLLQGPTGWRFLAGERPMYRGTSLKGKRTLLGPYRRLMPGVIGGLQGGGRFLMGEVPHRPTVGSKGAGVFL